MPRDNGSLRHPFITDNVDKVSCGDALGVILSFRFSSGGRFDDGPAFGLSRADERKRLTLTLGERRKKSPFLLRADINNTAKTDFIDTIGTSETPHWGITMSPKSLRADATPPKVYAEPLCRGLP